MRSRNRLLPFSNGWCTRNTYGLGLVQPRPDDRAQLIVSGCVLILSSDDRTELLKAREAVWRSWFADDTKTLEALVPPDTIVISSGEEKWKNQADILESAAKFHAAGGKLVRPEFPRTEIQRFADVAITYSQYLYETEVDGKHRSNLRPRHRSLRLGATATGPTPAGTPTQRNKIICDPAIGIFIQPYFCVDSFELHEPKNTA